MCLLAYSEDAKEGETKHCCKCPEAQPYNNKIDSITFPEVIPHRGRLVANPRFLEEVN
jgi:hypothetical protein